MIFEFVSHMLQLGGKLDLKEGGVIAPTIIAQEDKAAERRIGQREWKPSTRFTMDEWVA